MKKNRRYFVFGILFSVFCYWSFNHFRNDLAELNSSVKEKISKVSLVD